MGVRRLGPNDYRRMPWKNGGGETVEIAIAPEGAGLDAFDWRVSLARVVSDGPFSTFPDIDRTLAVVAGAGIDLVFAGGPPVSLTPSDAPHFFAADVAVAGRLRDGPIIDLNVMGRRGRVRHALLRLAAPQVVEIAPGGIGFLYSHDGGALAGAGPALEAGATAVLTGAEHVDPGPSRAAFLVVLHPDGLR